MNLLIPELHIIIKLFILVIILNSIQYYKNDVSKTFKILDNELVMINDHLKKQNENATTRGTLYQRHTFLQTP